MNTKTTSAYAHAQTEAGAGAGAGAEPGTPAQALAAEQPAKDMLHKLARDNRLMAEKLLSSRKDQIRLEVMQDGQKKLTEHIAALNTRLGKPYMPAIASDFAGT